MKLKFKNKSRLLALLAFTVFLFSIFKTYVAFSMSNLFILENISILSKSETLNEGTINIVENKISANSIKFHKVGDYIKYSVKIKNNKNENYILKSISDNNKNEYLSYSYDNYKNIKLNAGKSFDFVFTEIYSKEVEDIAKREQTSSVNFYFTLEKQKEDKPEEPEEDKPEEPETESDTTSDTVEETLTLNKNPATGDHIEFYVVLGIISFGLLMLILAKTNMKKIKKSSLTLLILFATFYLAFLPQIAKSLENQTYKIIIENNFELKDKLLVYYNVDGTINSKIIPYKTTVSIDEPYKEGYTFKGWQTDDGKLFDLNTSIEDDINLTAVFEANIYHITYNLDGGQAENPDSYTTENETQIDDPLKTGYTFEGWTGTDLTELTKNLIIPQGSFGDRIYDAHWSPNEYTIIFDKNTGEGDMDSVTAQYDTPMYLPSNNFTKENEKFLYWNTQPDGSGTSYNNEAYIKNLTSEGEITLYAQWISPSNWAMFKDGRFVNAKMKQLAGSSGASYTTIDNNILSIERSPTPAPEGSTTVSVKSNYSPSPLNMWYDSTNKTIYYYSPAKYIYLNTDGRNMFGYFSALKNIDYSGFRTDETTNMFGLFGQSKSLSNIDLNSFNTSKVTDMGSMFNQCNSATNINVSNFDTRNVTNMNRMFTACDSVVNLDLSRFNTSKVTNMEKMFDKLPSIKSIDVTNFDTKNVTTMCGMFRDCPNLNTLDLSSFDTRNVTNMSEMFGINKTTEETNASLTANINSIIIDTSKFNTAKVTTMQQMFYKCVNLRSFDFSGFNTSKVTNMASMLCYCTSMTNIDLSSFDTSKVTNMSSMFNQCNSATNINVSNFDTRNVTNMNRMFSSCNSIQTLDISNFSTASVTNMEKMFDNMLSLTTIYASYNFTTGSVTTGSNMFKNDENLVGGNGTECNGVSNIGYTYARLDNPPSEPGYFTSKQI